jgi:hypothetical protein
MFHALMAFVRDFYALLRGRPLECERYEYTRSEQNMRDIVASMSRGNIALSQSRFVSQDDLERERAQVGKLKFR